MATNDINDNSDLDLAIARVQLANAESDIRGLQNKMKARKKASDHSKMNPVYKPAASPGPIASAANVREGRSVVKGPQPGAANVRENRTSSKSVTPSAANQRESRVSSKSTRRTSRGD